MTFVRIEMTYVIQEMMTPRHSEQIHRSPAQAPRYPAQPIVTPQKYTDPQNKHPVTPHKHPVTPHLMRGPEKKDKLFFILWFSVNDIIGSWIPEQDRDDERCVSVLLPHTTYRHPAQAPRYPARPTVTPHLMRGPVNKKVTR